MTSSIDNLKKEAYWLKKEENRIYRRILEINGLTVHDDELDYSIPSNDLKFYVDNKMRELLELHLLAIEYYLDDIRYEITEMKFEHEEMMNRLAKRKPSF